jgi:hypothetical protein
MKCRRFGCRLAVALVVVVALLLGYAFLGRHLLAVPGPAIAWIPTNDSANLLKAHPARGLDTLGWSEHFYNISWLVG